MKERTYRCNRCWDSGVITIVHPETVTAIRNNRDEFIESGTIYTAIRRCTCMAGERYPSFPTFHVSNVVMPAVCRGTPEEQRKAYVAEYDAHCAPSDFANQFS